MAAFTLIWQAQVPLQRAIESIKASIFLLSPESAQAAKLSWCGCCWAIHLCVERAVKLTSLGCSGVHLHLQAEPHQLMRNWEPLRSCHHPRPMSYSANASFLRYAVYILQLSAIRRFWHCRSQDQKTCDPCYRISEFFQNISFMLPLSPTTKQQSCTTAAWKLLLISEGKGG